MSVVSTDRNRHIPTIGYDYYTVHSSQGASPVATWFLVIFSLGSLCLVPCAASQIQPLRGAEQKVFSNTSGWSDQFALPGPNFDVTALTSNEDAVFVAGAFSHIGKHPVQSLVRWDRATQTWEEIGGGLSLANGEGLIQALAVGEAGELYVAGTFAEPGGDFFSKVAVWNGESWHVFGGSLDPGSVSDLLFHNGVLYASGAIPGANGAFEGVVHWDGNAWLPLGEGTSGTAASLAVDAEGSIYAGGAFSPEGNVIYGVGRWDGSAWSFLDSRIEDGIQPGPLVSSLSIWGDQLYVAGHFDTIGGINSNSVARWDGQEWHALEMSQFVFLPEIAVLSSGQIYLGSGFTLYAWDGQAWSDPGLSLPFEIQLLEQDGDELFIGGVSVFGDLVPPASVHLYRYDGSELNVFHTEGAYGITGQIHVLAADAEYVYAGGEFNFAGLAPGQNIARWDGMQWTVLGAGLDGAVLALALDATGSLYAGGRFTRSGATEVHHVAVWDGAQWQPLGDGVDGPVNVLLVAGDDLYVGGYFDTATDATGTVAVRNLARWDGTQWHEVGDGVEGSVNSLALGDDGILYVGGSFEEQGGLLTGHGVRAWDGVQWIPLGGDFRGPVWTVAWHDGMLYAGGNFIESLGDPGNGIVRWDGQRWQALGAGTQGPNLDVEDIAFSDRGDLYATGWFSGAGDVPASLVARWDGAQWHPLDGGLYGNYGLALAIKEREVYVGGAFLSAEASLFSGGIPAGNFARWTIPIDLPIEEEGQPPTSLELHQNYPNPFSERTTISYVLPRPSRVELVVYDVLGRGVATLVDAWQAAGKHTVVFDARQLPGGVYFCRLSTDYRVETRSMTVLR